MRGQDRATKLDLYIDKIRALPWSKTPMREGLTHLLGTEKNEVGGDDRRYDADRKGVNDDHDSNRELVTIVEAKKRSGDRLGTLPILIETVGVRRVRVRTGGMHHGTRRWVGRTA